jgi:hypothetical protein
MRCGSRGALGAARRDAPTTLYRAKKCPRFRYRLGGGLRGGAVGWVQRPEALAFIPPPLGTGPAALEPGFTSGKTNSRSQSKVPNDSRARWLASASAPALRVADLVAGRVPRNEEAPTGRSLS